MLKFGDIFGDGRTYYETEVAVGTDTTIGGANWQSPHYYALDGTYAETSGGKKF